MQIEVVDNFLREKKISFDSSIILKDKILYFKDGLLTVEVVAIIKNGNVHLDIFESKNKLRDSF